MVHWEAMIEHLHYVFEGPSKIEEIMHNLVDLYNKYRMKCLDMACVVFGESSGSSSGAPGGNDRASTSMHSNLAKKLASTKDYLVNKVISKTKKK